jgi:hypothetical protein
MKIKEIWEELINDKSSPQGLLARRYSSSVLPELYLAVQHPEKIIGICIYFDKGIKINTESLTQLQEISMSFYPAPNEPSKNVLMFKLLNFEHKDIFAVLCEDLILSVANETNQSKLIKEVLNRFEKWKSLFNKLSSTGLKSEEQRGLFGELYFINDFLTTNKNYLNLVNTWVGPEKQVRDFQNQSWAIEVKTTHGNNHQKITISSERQLDTNNLEYLFLYHISLDKRNNSGTSLNELVDSIYEILRDDTLALNRFKGKLFESGYFEYQRPLYEGIGYFIRQDTFYKVADEFPRIEERNIPMGVGDVKYSIILSQCTSFITEKTEVFNIINTLT